MNKKPLGVYVHIPFCVKKCNYCDFLSAPGNLLVFREYVLALKTSIKACSVERELYDLQTIYFGGGTPSVLPPEFLSEISESILEAYNVKSTQLREFTVEVNPGTIDSDKLKTYRQMGADRLSMGVQSANDEELKLLGRIHSFSDAVEGVKVAKKAGFSNISLDVMAALPGQSMETYSENLDRILELEPKHISSYSLILEEGTPFYERYVCPGKEKAMLPSEELDRRMYVLTKEKLAAAGFERYEISNYAKPGFESIHNSSYWIGTDYRGFGVGAASLIDNKRFTNSRNLQEYIKNPLGCSIDEVLELDDRMAEFMILGLRMTKGISGKEFENRFGKNLLSVYGKEIEKLEGRGLLTRKGDQVFLTEIGLDLSNMVFEAFI